LPREALILADLQTVDRAVLRLEKEARVRKEARAVLNTALRARAILDGGQTLFSVHRTITRGCGPRSGRSTTWWNSAGKPTATSSVRKPRAPGSSVATRRWLGSQSTPAMAAKLLVFLTDDRVRLLTRAFHTPAPRTV
jgi:hypothetical protein